MPPLSPLHPAQAGPLGCPSLSGLVARIAAHPKRSPAFSVRILKELPPIFGRQPLCCCTPSVTMMDDEEMLEMQLQALEAEATQFDTYEDYLDSQIQKIDLYYL